MQVWPRQKLFSQLNGLTQYPAIWLNGPAGSGKTTLVASYLENNNTDCLWYQLDEGDSDPAGFFHYLSLAALSVLGEGHHPLPPLTPEYMPGLTIYTRRYFETLFSLLPHPVVLVLDNYQLLPTDSIVHSIILQAIETIPEGVQLIAISRALPPQQFVRAQVNNSLAVTGQADLNLEAEEIKDFIKVMGGPQISDQENRLLHARTKGWLAALILLLKRAEREEGGDWLDVTAIEEQISDYFASELFAGLSEEMQKFLLTISVLPSMTGEMAEELSGNQQAAAHLTWLNKNNFFTERKDGQPLTFQLHPLFQEFLLSQTADYFGPAELKALQHKAGRLLADNDLIENAIQLLFQVEAYEKIFELLIAKAPMLLAQGRHGTVEQWLLRLPDDLRESNPWLLYWLGNCRMPFNPGESTQFFAKALQLFSSQSAEPGVLLALCGMADSTTFSFDRYDRFDQLIPQFEAFDEKNPLFNDPTMGARLTLSMLSTLVNRNPTHPAITDLERRAHTMLATPLPTELKSYLLLILICHYAFSGNLKKMEYSLNLYREIAKLPDISPLAMTTLYGLETFGAFLQGRFKLSLQAARQGLELAGQTGVFNMNILTLGNGAAGALSNGNMKVAGEMMAQMEPLLVYGGSWQKEYYHVLQMWKGLLENNVSLLTLHAELGLEQTRKAGMRQTTAITCLGAALAYRLANKSEEAEGMLSKSLEICRQYNAKQAEYSCYLTAAEWAMADEDQDRLQEALQSAMNLGRQEGYYNTWLWRSKSMATLCVKALELEIEVDYVRELVSKRNLIPETAPLTLTNWPWPIRIYTLGRFGITLADTPLHFKGKAQQKPLILLKAIIAMGGREVPEVKLNDALWPDLDGDAAHNSFSTTLHRLRKLLDHKEAVVLSKGKVTINDRVCWVDLWCLEKELNRISNSKKSDQQLSQEVGNFLAGEDEYWLFPMRDKIARKIAECSATTRQIS